MVPQRSPRAAVFVMVPAASGRLAVRATYMWRRIWFRTEIDRFRMCGSTVIHSKNGASPQHDSTNGSPQVAMPTFLSRSASHKSFTVQPAPRSSSAPVPNSANSVRSGGDPGGAASAMDQKHGHASSQVPVRRVEQLPLLSYHEERGGGRTFGKNPCSAASAMDQKHGHTNSQVPVGKESNAAAS